MIKVQWTSNFYLATKARNKNSIKNVKISAWERLCTFEGPATKYEELAVRSPYILKKIKKNCDRIEKHISDVTGDLICIRAMTLYFKQDQNEALWLLFAQEISFRSNDNSLAISLSVPVMKLSKPTQNLSYKFLKKHFRINNRLQTVGELQPQEYCPNCLGNCFINQILGLNFFR